MNKQQIMKLEICKKKCDEFSIQNTKICHNKHLKQIIANDRSEESLHNKEALMNKDTLHNKVRKSIIIKTAFRNDE